MAMPAGRLGDTRETYTDSEPLGVLFAAGSRITVSLLPPQQPQFPPVCCSFEGLNITIHYEASQDSTQQKSDSTDSSFCRRWVSGFIATTICYIGKQSIA